MAKQLNIRSDEAYETAQRLASHLNKSATAVVETALKEYGVRQIGLAGSTA